MLSAGDIASMRATAEETLVESATIGRRTEVSDGGGGHTTTHPTVATVDCARAPLDQQGSDEAVQGERITPELEWVMTLPQGTDVRASDQLTIDGQVYEVLAIRAARTWELTRRVECKRID